MRGRIQSPVACQQPFFVRQGSRGDVLISRVVKAYKSKVREIATLYCMRIEPVT